MRRPRHGGARSKRRVGGAVESAGLLRARAATSGSGRRAPLAWWWRPFAVVGIITLGWLAGGGPWKPSDDPTVDLTVWTAAGCLVSALIAPLIIVLLMVALPR